MLIEVFHDTVCPWCRIGKRNLNLALERWQGEPVQVRYRTFFLNNGMPSEGWEYRSFMQAKGGGRVPLETFFERPRRAGANVGLTFNFEKIERAPNTLLSHRLIALTPDDDKAAMIEALYDAYFEHGRDIGDLDVLVSIAAQQGLEGDEIRARLLTDDAREQVIEEDELARSIGISGVPFFIVDKAYVLSGAQPPEVILRVLEQAGQAKTS